MRNKNSNNLLSALVKAVTTASIMFCVLTTGTVAWSQTGRPNEPKAEKKKVTQKSIATPTVSGQQVSVDPQTKQIRPPTAEESRALLEGLRNPAGHPPGQVRIYQLPNGMLAARLPEEYMDAMVVRRNPDGTLSAECIKGMKAASERLQSNAAQTSESAPGTTKAKDEGKEAGKKAGKASPNPSLEEKE